MVRTWFPLHFLETNFPAIFCISNKVTHEPHPKPSQKCLLCFLHISQKQKGLRFRIIFLNKTEVCAF